MSSQESLENFSQMSEALSPQNSSPTSSTSSSSDDIFETKKAPESNLPEIKKILLTSKGMPLFIVSLGEDR